MRLKSQGFSISEVTESEVAAASRKAYALLDTNKAEAESERRVDVSSMQKFPVPKGYSQISQWVLHVSKLVSVERHAPPQRSQRLGADVASWPLIVPHT